MFLFFVNQDQGAYNSAFAAGSEEVALEHRGGYKGKYIMPVGKLAEPTKVASNEKLAKEL
ncbi:hypothetical protein BDR07DRAFT_1442444 [Suillus spraguei]|nr:hypothetical protein BDR07DRAFT_1442444 [Suillus spraguei]